MTLHSPNINTVFSEYGNGYTLYASDLTPDLASADTHTSVVKSGIIDIDIKLDKPLLEVTLVTYAEYRNLIETDKTLAAFTDY